MFSENIEVYIALIASIGSAFVSLTTAYISKIENRKLAKLEADLKLKEKVNGEIVRYGEPLLQSAFELQSRLYNIFFGNFLMAYYVHGTEHQKEYAIESTLFLFAQFFGLAELIRIEQQIIDLGKAEDTRALRSLLGGIVEQLRTDRYGPFFQIFTLDQRAIGELMRVPNEFKTIGYAEFLTAKPERLEKWLARLREELMLASHDLSLAKERFVSIQWALIDLIDFLDADKKRFPLNRMKIEL